MILPFGWPVTQKCFLKHFANNIFEEEYFWVGPILYLNNIPLYHLSTRLGVLMNDHDPNDDTEGIFWGSQLRGDDCWWHKLKADDSFVYSRHQTPALDLGPLPRCGRLTLSLWLIQFSLFLSLLHCLLNIFHHIRVGDIHIHTTKVVVSFCFEFLF